MGGAEDLGQGCGSFGADAIEAQVEMAELPVSVAPCDQAERGTGSVGDSVGEGARL